MLSISFAIFPVCALIAFAIAIAGQKLETRGAIVVTVASWLLVSYLVLSAGDIRLSWWTHFSVSMAMTSVSLALIAAPMFAMRSADWNKGRLIAGLIGGVAGALVFPPVLLMSACEFLNECL